MIFSCNKLPCLAKLWHINCKFTFMKRYSIRYHARDDMKNIMRIDSSMILLWYMQREVRKRKREEMITLWYDIQIRGIVVSSTLSPWIPLTYFKPSTFNMLSELSHFSLLPSLSLYFFPKTEIQQILSASFPIISFPFP